MGKFSQYRLKFRDEWKADPLFHKWIENVDDDSLKAYCKFCRVFLPAHYAGLTDHAAGSKHCKIAIHFENEAFNGSTSAVPQKRKMSSSQPFVCKSSMPRKEGLSSECDVQRRSEEEGLCTLELTVEDETAQPCIEDVSMNFKNKNGKRNIQAPQRQRNDDKEANGWADGPLTSDDSKIFNQMQADPVQRRKSKFVSSDLSPQDQKLQDLRKRMKMLQSCDKGVTNFRGVSNLILGSNEGSYEDAVCLKQETTEDIGEMDNDRVTNKLLEVRVDDCDDNGLKDIGSLISATDPTIWPSQEEPIHLSEYMSTKNKEGKTDPMLVKRYPQKYVTRWNSDPALKDWVTPVAGNVYRAKCQWCQVELRAHYKDLKHHALSTKHTNSAATRHVDPASRDSSGKISPPDKDFFKSGLSRKFKRSSEAADHKLKQSSCYFLSRSSWDRYKQKYRKAWEIDPNFCGWIAPVEGDVFRARCIYCHVLIRAHHRDLKEHSRTTKHATNITFGVPFNGSHTTSLATVLPKAKRPRQRSTVKQRLKLAPCLTSNPHSADAWQNDDDLLRPDDSLTSVENLVSLATRPYNVPDESTVTTLVFPNASRLDESVAAALPSNNPKTQYRVKKLSSASASVSAKSNEVSATVATDDRATRLMKRLSLWEFLRMKVGRCSSAGGGLRIPRLLLEFESLHEQIKRITEKCLEPIVLGSAGSIPSSDSVMVLNSEHLAELLGIAVGHYRIKDPPTDIEDDLALDALEKSSEENASISAVDLSLLPSVVQSLENCHPTAAASDYGVHPAAAAGLFRANGLVVEPSEEGVTSDPHSLVFSPADHIMQLQDVACLTSGANGNSLLYSNADHTGTLLIQVNGAPGHAPHVPLFNAKDDDDRRRRGRAVDADKEDLKTS